MKWLTPDETARVKKWLDSGDTPGGKFGSLHRLFVVIALESGLRQMEILDLTHEQANLTEETWVGVLRLKRDDKARIDSYLGPRTATIYREMFPTELPGIFNLELEGKIFDEGPTSGATYKFLKRLGKRLKIQGGLNVHRFRHTAGRDMDRAGFTPSEIQAALGQKSAGMALLYSQATNEEGRAALKEIRGVD